MIGTNWQGEVGRYEVETECTVDGREYWGVRVNNCGFIHLHEKSELPGMIERHRQGLLARIA